MEENKQFIVNKYGSKEELYKTEAAYFKNLYKYYKSLSERLQKAVNKQ